MNNCPNCGGVIDSSQNKCSYCGTSYFDLSCIDVDNSKPVYLKIKIRNRVITALASLQNINVTNLCEPIAFRDCNGFARRFISNQSTSINMEFDVLSTVRSTANPSISLKEE